MTYYAVYQDGVLNHIGKGTGQGEAISQQEYDALAAQIAQVAAYIGQVASGAMELAEVPEQYREQVAREVAAIGPEEPVQMTETETALTQMGVQVYE